MYQLLNDKVAIVTGGGGALGAGIAQGLAQAGAAVVLAAGKLGAARAEANTIVVEVGQALAVACDVADSGSVEAMVAQTIATYGGVDILVNNAAITRDRTFRKLTSDDWRRVIDTNLNSVFYCTHSAVPAMIDQGGGKIINISSIVALSGNIGQTNYTAAKGGLISFTKSLALELARYKILVNCVAPGFIDTDMLSVVPENIRETIIARIPVRRFGKPEEIAKAVRFLCVDGDYVTGQTISVNGGLYM